MAIAQDPAPTETSATSTPSPAATAISGDPTPTAPAGTPTSTLDADLDAHADGHAHRLLHAVRHGRAAHALSPRPWRPWWARPRPAPRPRPARSAWISRRRAASAQAPQRPQRQRRDRRPGLRRRQEVEEEPPKSSAPFRTQTSTTASECDLLDVEGARGRPRRRHPPRDRARRRHPDPGEPGLRGRYPRRGSDRRPELLHRQVPHPALPPPRLPGRRHGVRRALGGAGGDQRDRDRLRPQPQRVHCGRARAGCSSCRRPGRPTASTPTATA